MPFDQQPIEPGSVMQSCVFWPLLFVALLMAALFCGGCATNVTVSDTSVQNEPVVKTVAVLPFRDMARIYGEDVHVRAPVTGKMFKTGTVAPGAPGLLDEALAAQLLNRKDAGWIPADQTRSILLSLPAEKIEKMTPQDAAMSVGEACDAQAVLCGWVFRFRERMGNAYSVDQPASVAIELVLLHVPDGRMLWKGHIDETQRSLSEDVLQWGKFLKRRGTWITAEEMSRAGLADILQDLVLP